MKFQEIAALLSGNYRHIFLEVDKYATNCQIVGWKYKLKMLNLFEILLLAQEKESDIETVIDGQETIEFAKQYFKTYRWYDYLIPVMNFMAFLWGVSLICALFYGYNEISIQFYIRQNLLLMVMLFVGPISRKYNNGKVNWKIGVPIILIYGVLSSAITNLTIPSEQFYTLFYIAMVCYALVKSWTYWNRKTVMKTIQEKYYRYLKQSQYIELTHRFHDNGVITWQALLHNAKKSFKYKLMTLELIGLMLMLATIIILWYSPFDKNIQVAILSLVLFGMTLLYEPIYVNVHKIKNIQLFEQEH